jgi:hypothetical protein
MYPVLVGLGLANRLFLDLLTAFDELRIHSVKIIAVKDLRVLADKLKQPLSHLGFRKLTDPEAFDRFGCERFHGFLSHRV